MVHQRFIIYCCNPHRGIHSFPTRRSSDLGSVEDTTERPSPDSTAPVRSIHSPNRSCWKRMSRSEEHTSELQSHHDLVCRLLLEKKKNILLKSNGSTVSGY